MSFEKAILDKAEAKHLNMLNGITENEVEHKVSDIKIYTEKRKKYISRLNKEKEGFNNAVKLAMAEHARVEALKQEEQELKEFQRFKRAERLKATFKITAIVVLITAVIIGIVSCCVSKYNENYTWDSGVRYALDDDHYVIDKTDKDISGDIKLLSEIGGIPVTYIEEEAFYNRNIKSVTISRNIESIGAGAFEASKIKTLKFEQGSVCETIGRGAFYSCENLESVEIPESVIKIVRYAFDRCYNLKSARIVAPNGWKISGWGIVAEDSFKNLQKAAEILRLYSNGYSFVR